MSYAIRKDNVWYNPCNNEMYFYKSGAWHRLKEGDEYRLSGAWVEIECGPPVPVCPDRVLVFQICNSNSLVDDNFNIYLNNILIGSVNLAADAQIGSVFIGSLDEPDIVSADFVCPLGGMVSYYFDPSIILGGPNEIKMINIQNNGNGNEGTVGVRNYLLSGSNLSSPCVVADLMYSGASGENYTLPFSYTACCPEDED